MRTGKKIFFIGVFISVWLIVCHEIYVLSGENPQVQLIGICGIYVLLFGGSLLALIFGIIRNKPDFKEILLSVFRYLIFWAVMFSIQFFAIGSSDTGLLTSFFLWIGFVALYGGVYFTWCHLQRQKEEMPFDNGENDEAPSLRIKSAFKKLKAKNSCPDLKGGTIRTLFGSLVLDLSSARWNGTLELSALTVAGSLTVIVPEKTAAELTGGGILGFRLAQTEKWSKGARRLRLNGAVVFGKCKVTEGKSCSDPKDML